MSENTEIERSDINWSEVLPKMVMPHTTAELDEFLSSLTMRELNELRINGQKLAYMAHMAMVQNIHSQNEIDDD